MKNRKYIYVALVAFLAILFVAQTNTYAVQNNLAAKGIVLDGKANDGTSFQQKQVDLGEAESEVDLSEKGKKFYGTSPRGKDISVFYLWIGYMKDMWYKQIIQDK